MTYEELNNLISELASALNLPFAYHHFSKKTSPPFLIFDYPNNDDFYADGINYQENVVVELYFCSDFKDLETENAIGAFLKNNEISYEKNQDYINDEMMWQTTYTMEVLINE